jgi:hypothetical protein
LKALPPNLRPGRAIKEYTYMDQAPVQNVDVVKGLETTLTILNHN